MPRAPGNTTTSACCFVGGFPGDPLCGNKNVTSNKKRASGVGGLAVGIGMGVAWRRCCDRYRHRRGLGCAQGHTKDSFDGLAFRGRESGTRAPLSPAPNPRVPRRSLRTARRESRGRATPRAPRPAVARERRHAASTAAPPGRWSIRWVTCRTARFRGPGGSPSSAARVPPAPGAALPGSSPARPRSRRRGACPRRRSRPRRRVSV